MSKIIIYTIPLTLNVIHYSELANFRSPPRIKVFRGIKFPLVPKMLFPLHESGSCSIMKSRLNWIPVQEVNLITCWDEKNGKWHYCECWTPFSMLQRVPNCKSPAASKWQENKWEPQSRAKFFIESQRTKLKSIIVCLKSKSRTFRWKAKVSRQQPGFLQPLQASTKW